MIIGNKLLKSKIIELLNREYSLGEKIIDEIEDLKKILTDPADIENFYSTLLNIIAHIDLKEEDAKQHWNNIVKRYKELLSSLGRVVSIRTAVIDYFTYNNEIMKNPIIIEIFLYDVAESKVYIDEMTGLYNYRYLKEALWAETSRSERYNLFFSITVIDIDDIKTINAQYGIEKGDEVIRAVARILDLNRRAEDTVFRYSGDEFIVLLPETSKSGAIAFISRIKRKLEEHFSKKEINITISAGISEFPSDSKDPVQLLEFANKALYEAKFRGKNRIVGYSPSINI